MRITLILSFAFLAVSAGAATHYLAPDVPASLGGTDFTPNQIVLSESASYSAVETLPADLALGALHREEDGLWLFSPAHAVDLGGTTYETRDVVSWDGSVYAMVLDGSAVGIPDYAGVDGLFRDAAGVAVLSFDVPVNLGGTEYSRSDLVSWDGSFGLYWDGQAAGVPAYANVTGADQLSAGKVVLAFDVPVDLGGAEYLPGELVLHDGSFSSYFADGGWPAYAQIRGFCFLSSAGRVPDGSALPGTPLMATRSGADVTLTWSASCSSGADDYIVYEGTMGAFTSHAPLLSCTTAGLLTETFTPGSGSRYYLVVPRNADTEGSYGTDSGGSPRPASLSACVPPDVSPCP